MKILILCDVFGWAISELSIGIKKYSPQHEIKIEYIGPRDVAEKADEFIKTVKEFKPDLIDYQYFRTATQLIDLKPELKEYKSVLSHHNQRDKALYSVKWEDYGIDMLVGHTQICCDKLIEKGYVNTRRIDLTIDVKDFPYSEEEPKDNNVGYAGRIVPWKRLADIARISGELGYKVKAMGRMDKADYQEEVNAQAQHIDFEFFDCKDEERIQAYRDMKVFVMYSTDGLEEGPLPVLEAMASGVPVIATPTGIVNDIGKDRENMLIVTFDDEEALKDAITELMNDPELRKKLKRKAWQDVKSYDRLRYARRYQKVYNEVVYPQDKMVSVILPITNDRTDELVKTLESIKAQTYKAVEVLVVDDGDNQTNQEAKDIVKEYRQDGLTVKYFNSAKFSYDKKKEEYVKDYGLARARNIGVIESLGEYLLFLDNRFELEPDAIEKFVNVANVNEKTGYIWYFGDKGSGKKDFVENFSFAKRKEVIDFGMFNERIDKYGGMSQEIRERWWKHDGNFIFIEKAKCKELRSSKNSSKKRDEIIDMKNKLYKIYGK